MVYCLPSDCRVNDEEVEVSQLNLVPKNAIFEKITGDALEAVIYQGTTVNLMPYSVFKKLDFEDHKITKTNMMLSGFE